MGGDWVVVRCGVCCALGVRDSYFVLAVKGVSAELAERALKKDLAEKHNLKYHPHDQVTYWKCLHVLNLSNAYSSATFRSASTC